MHNDESRGADAAIPTTPAVTPAATPASEPKAVQRAKAGRTRAPSTPYRHGKGYAIRRSHNGHGIFLSGFKTAKAAEKAMTRRVTSIDDNDKPEGYGPARTSVAQALQDYAVARLPFLKGAEQEARRINNYLRPAGLRLLKVNELPRTSPTKGKSGKGAHFEVALVAHTAERTIPKGLGAHRKALLTANAGTDKWRAVLATTPVSDVTRKMCQDFMDAMAKDGNSPATVGLERAVLRRVFNHAFTKWKWAELRDNPATRLDMPTVDNDRTRVLGLNEQELLDAAIADCRNELVGPTVVLLRETAMRVSEPLKRACWRDVDFERKVLSLPDAKTGKRDVPLSVAALEALQTLRAIGQGEDDEPIIRVTYQALSAAWRRALGRAGIEDLHLHDLRHTAATRMALKYGNVFLVQALTGLKTMQMLERYVNVTADDVVKLMHGDSKAAAASAEKSGKVDSKAKVASVESDGAVEGRQVAGDERLPDEVQLGGNVLAFPQRRRA